MSGKWPHRLVRKRPAPLGRNTSIAFDESGACYCLLRAETDSKPQWTLWRPEDGAAQELFIPGPVRHPLIAPHPSQGIVVIDAICPWRPNRPPAHNAHLFDRNGTRLSSFHGGSSVMDVQCAANGEIWISFFDEGVFGNHGWNSTGPAGLGRGGLVCLDTAGNVLWSHNDREDAERFIDDCYALNVVGDEAWFYFYSDFHLGQHRRKGGRPRYTKVPVSGCGAFAKSGNRFVFSAGYGKQPTRGHLFRMKESGKRSSVAVDLSSDETAGMNRKNTLIKGRGGWLHLIMGETCVSYHVDDLAI